jgi:hypothetical protein
VNNDDDANFPPQGVIDPAPDVGIASSSHSTSTSSAMADDDDAPVPSILSSSQRKRLCMLAIRVSMAT